MSKYVFKWDMYAFVICDVLFLLTLIAKRSKKKVEQEKGGETKKIKGFSLHSSCLHCFLVAFASALRE
jgi:hypothetical protein